MPRLARKDKREDGREVDSRKFSGQVRNAVDAAEGVAGFDVEPIQVVDGPDPMNEAQAAAFAEEKLTILIHQSPEKLPEDPVYVGVNGRGCYIWRGQKTLVPRKYVERLLRAQADNITQDVTATTEREFNKLTIRPTQRYPLSVLHDPSPIGAAWLQQITEQA